MVWEWRYVGFVSLPFGESTEVNPGMPTRLTSG